VGRKLLDDRRDRVGANEENPYQNEIVISWPELHRDARYLSSRLNEAGEWKGIIAITRGGLVPAALVARELDIRLIDTVCVVSYAGAAPEPGRRRQNPGRVALAQERRRRRQDWLLIDDLVDTGKTARAVRERLPKAHFATLYAKPQGRPLVDTFVKRVQAGESGSTFPGISTIASSLRSAIATGRSDRTDIATRARCRDGRGRATDVASPALSARPGPCAAARIDASADFPGNRPAPTARFAPAPDRPSAAAESDQKPAVRPPGARPSCGYTSLSSLPRVLTMGAPALGLTQIQSMPAGTAIVPLVSSAISKPPIHASASSNARIDLQQRFAAGEHDQIDALGDRAATGKPIRAASEAASGVLPALGAVRADEIRVAETAYRSRLDRASRPGPQDCSRQSGKTPPGGRHSDPRPAACRRSP
jgi:xanthine phosphoribosyltransferase